MDNNSNNTSLLGFLQKKSLFSNSPANKTRNRSRSNSRDGRFAGSRSNVYQLEDKNETAQGKFNYQEDNIRNYERLQGRNEDQGLFKTYNNNEQRGRYQPLNNDARQYQSIAPSYNNDIRIDERAYQTNLPRSDLRGEARNFNIPSPSGGDIRMNLYPQDERFFKTSDVRSNRYYQGNRSNASRPSDHPENQVWAGLVAHTHTFESARLESIQCLDSLSGRLATEIANINFKIDSFNTTLSKTLSNEFRSMREKVLHMVDAVFRESDRFIKEYMRQQQSKMAGDIAHIRESLLKEQAKIDIMKEELKKPNWRKTAGEILTTELQKKVEEMIRTSSQMEVGHWQLGDLGGSHLNRIQAELRELVKIKQFT